jgi:hypothetical protein
MRSMLEGTHDAGGNALNVAWPLRVVVLESDILRHNHQDTNTYLLC